MTAVGEGLDLFESEFPHVQKEDKTTVATWWAPNLQASPAPRGTGMKVYCDPLWEVLASAWDHQSVPLGLRWS